MLTFILSTVVEQEETEIKQEVDHEISHVQLLIPCTWQYKFKLLILC